MHKWGIFNTESQFNDWLEGDGEGPLLGELKTFFGMEFERCDIKDSFFGLPDHTFFSKAHRRLILVESADVLNKKHLAKDFLYLFENPLGFDIQTKVLFWILLTRPSEEIIEKIRVMFEQTIIGTCRPQFHVSTITNIGSSSLRLNIEISFGDRLLLINNRDILSRCIGPETWFSVKEVGRILGVPYTTCFNVLKRWQVEIVDSKVSLKALKEMIKRIEQKASSDLGIDFNGKFVPINAKSDDMLFPAELNRILGRKGNAVRVKIKPQWITISGPVNRGYRLLYDKINILSMNSIKE